MHKFLKADLVLAFVIVCIAMTLTVVVAFATPGESFEMHRTHPFPSTNTPVHPAFRGRMDRPARSRPRQQRNRMMTRNALKPRKTGRGAVLSNDAPLFDAPSSKAQEEADRRLDEQLEETFPASDPPSILRRG